MRPVLRSKLVYRTVDKYAKKSALADWSLKDWSVLIRTEPISQQIYYKQLLNRVETFSTLLNSMCT